MSSLPEGWLETSLGEVIGFVVDNRGKTPPLSEGKEYELLEVNAVGESSREPEYSKVGKFVDKNTFDTWFRKGTVKQGDVLIPTVGTIGNAAYSKQERGAIAQNLIALRANEKSHPMFLYYFMSNPMTKKMLLNLDIGGVQPSIKVPHLLGMQVLFPPLPEQKTIADMLSSFDEKIELLREQNKTLETLAQTIFKEWFVNFKAPQPPEGGDGGKSPSGDLGAEMVDSELGEIPKGWRVGSLLEVFDLIGGGTPKTSIDEYWNGGIPWYSVVDAPSGSETFVIDTEKNISALGLVKSSTKLLQKGTTIVSARGTVGKLALVGRETAMNQSCYGVKGKDSFGDYYVYFQIKEALASLKSRVHGAVFDTITQSTFKNIMVPLPDDVIVVSYEERVAPIMEKILNNVLQVQSLSKARDTLLPKLMKGDVRVKGDDTYDIKAICRRS